MINMFLTYYDLMLMIAITSNDLTLLKSIFYSHWGSIFLTSDNLSYLFREWDCFGGTSTIDFINIQYFIFLRWDCFKGREILD